MITVIGIVTSLASMAKPVYENIIDNAERSVCIHQMSQMQRLYATHVMFEPDATIADALAGNCDDLSDNYARYSCPSGGVYSEDENGKIQCSIHGGLYGANNSSNTSNSGNTPELLPGTNLRVYGSYWPQPEDFEEEWSVVPVEAGGVFEYDGVYYVLTEDINLTKGQAASGPGGDAWTGMLHRN